MRGAHLPFRFSILCNYFAHENRNYPFCSPAFVFIFFMKEIYFLSKSHSNCFWTKNQFLICYLFKFSSSFFAKVFAWTRVLQQLTKRTNNNPQHSVEQFLLPGQQFFLVFCTFGFLSVCENFLAFFHIVIFCCGGSADSVPCCRLPASAQYPDRCFAYPGCRNLPLTGDHRSAQL